MALKLILILAAVFVVMNWLTAGLDNIVTPAYSTVETTP